MCVSQTRGRKNPMWTTFKFNGSCRSDQTWYRLCRSDAMCECVGDWLSYVHICRLRVLDKVGCEIAHSYTFGAEDIHHLIRTRNGAAHLAVSDHSVWFDYAATWTLTVKCKLPDRVCPEISKVLRQVYIRGSVAEIARYYGVCSLR
jgi:hypothetical protein